MTATRRLYYDDSYLRQFTATVVDSADPLRVYLDRTAFYPNSGGQPADTGFLNGNPVLEVIDEGERIAHVLGAPLASNEVSGEIGWQRRFDHMQQHSGQHLLSAVLAEEYKVPTVSFHLGPETSTIDVEARALDLRAIEQRVNTVVYENRPLAVSYQDDAGGGLRKQVERTGRLRVITIENLDRSACGGTHVRTTAEIGPILLTRTEKVRNTLRVEFRCGLRATLWLREHLDAANQQLALQSERLASTAKARQKAVVELARYQGREAYQSGPHLRRTGMIDDEARAFAQAFTANPGAIFLQVCPDPPSFLLAVSTDSGTDAGGLVKSLLSAEGGRGGGTRQIAQGGVADRPKLESILATLTARLGF